MKKKFILGLGAAVTVIAPITAVVACSSNEEKVQRTFRTGDILDTGDILWALTGGREQQSMEDQQTHKQLVIKQVQAIEGITKDSSKEEVIKAINEYTELKDNVKKQLLIDFVGAQKSWMDAYYLIKFIRDALAPQNAVLAALAIKSSGDKTPSDIYTEIIRAGELSIQAVTNSLINKFSEQDDRFTSAVTTAATVDKEHNELKKEIAWGTGALAMGGDETIKYILNHANPRWDLVQGDQ